MKILLDECIPRLLKRLLSEFEVSTVQAMGWTGVTNGALLAMAEGEFDVFVKTDKNLRYQQNRPEDDWQLSSYPRIRSLLSPR